MGALAAGLALRLIGLGEPFVDLQAWRQADTAAIARNFYEEGYTPFHPRVDWRGTTSGDVEMNLPLFSFAVALLYGLAGGAQEWLGRLLAAALSTAAAALLYALVRTVASGPWTARLAAAVYLLSPLSWFYGRAFMPEALMVCLSVGALLAFARWLDAGGRLRFALAAATAGLCFAVKVPTLCLGAPLVALAWARCGWGFLRRGSMWLYLLLVLLPPLAWYGHAAALFRKTGLTFGIWGSAGYDKWSHALLATGGFWATIAERLLTDVLTPPGAALVAAGLIGLRPAVGPARRRCWVLHAWLAGLVAYVLLIPEGNRKLPYYQLPFVPVAAVFAAAPLAALLGDPVLAGAPDRWVARLRRRSRGAGPWLVAIALAAIAASSATRVHGYFRPGELYRYYRTCLAAGTALAAKLPAEARLVVGDLDDNSGAPFRAQSPTLLYFCHRKGWQITSDEFAAATLDSLAAAGATHFVAPAGLVLERREFWQSLLARGVGTAASYPRVWHDGEAFLAGANAHDGPERHVLVARLTSGPAR